MAWRLAQSLVVLSAEIRAISPKQTIYSIGDAAHASQASDHNPNAAGVVCAIDVMQGNGLDLAALAERIRARQHPAGKYVIYDRRIASASQAWAWRPYGGSDPHTDHIHVSVGVGPDGRSTGPYDDTSPWLSTEEEDMPLAHLWPDNTGQIWYVTGPLQTKRRVSKAEADTIRYYASGGGDAKLPGFTLVDMTRFGKADPSVIPGVDITDLATGGVSHAELEQAAFEGAQRAEKE